jgi:hypothetical protein
MLVEGLKKLVRESEPYIDQIKSKNAIQIGFRLIDSGEEASLIVQNKLFITSTTSDTICMIIMESSTFKSILKGEADFASLIARSKMSDKRPINYEIIKQERFSEAFEIIKSLMNNFFHTRKS